MAWLEDYHHKITYQISSNFLAGLKSQEYFIITDNNLKNLYQKAFFPESNFYSIKPGEVSKTLSQVNEILEAILELNSSRNLIIIGFGGGVVCDIAGFISAIYKRGCRLALMPTSVIAMVDASVGGKNGVNSLNFKNQFGTIKQPDYINLDFSLLSTLPDSEFANGIPEIIKHGLISSLDYYQKVKSANLTIYSESNSLIAEIIKESIAIKLSFVSGDEHDKGQRRFLNFGHTLGHVIEKQYNIPHGKAVLWGMIQAIKLSYAMKILPKELSKVLLNDLSKFNIIEKGMINWDDISESLFNDKKREGENITFILLAGVGKPVVRDLDLETIRQVVSYTEEELFSDNSSSCI